MDPSTAARKGEIALEVARLESLYPERDFPRIATEEDSALAKRYNHVCELRNKVNLDIHTLVQKYMDIYDEDQEDNDYVYAAALPFGTTLPDAPAVSAGTLWLMPFLKIRRPQKPDEIKQVVRTGLKYYIVPIVPDWIENARRISKIPTYHFKTLPARLFALEETPDEAELRSLFPVGQDRQVVDALLDERETYLRGMEAALEAVNNYQPYL